MKKRIIIGASGASGMPVLIKCLELIHKQLEFESWLIHERQCKNDFGTGNQLV